VKGFKVTVEDLESGDKSAVVVAAGDYLLSTFEPCHLAGTQVFPKAGTHVLTIKDYRPQDTPREVTP